MKSSRPQREAAQVGLQKNENEIDWEMRPCGMLVQRREEDDAACDGAGGNGPVIKINVSYGSSQHEIFVPSHSTFGEMKQIVAKRIGLDPAVQRLLFRGKEQEDEERLHLAGIKDNSKVVVLEDLASKEKKLEQSQASEEVSKASEAVAGITAEVDELSKRVAELEVFVHDGTKVEERKFVEPTELLMRQLLKLDGIEAQGVARVQRKAEVHRVQGLVDKLDSLKARNVNPFSNRSSAVSITTNWETFTSGVGSLNAPTPMLSSTEVTSDWEQFD
ncbi:BAG family molecular chaperone regulator 4 [Rhodamnia argentea]|uniref:BAG family molecular chaperone regulator 4 n=1 Tax=Rhodamnia argentea TaxID=178133 RepID=A0A8B8PRD8_9MYRT|nr:BAG family molecular chaperone regulator 4 [Rhodamnia argentea]